MKLDLDKEDLVALVRGSSPSYDLMRHPLIRELGNYDDIRCIWQWSYNLSNYTEEELYSIYALCKSSW